MWLEQVQFPQPEVELQRPPPLFITSVSVRQQELKLRNTEALSLKTEAQVTEPKHLAAHHLAWNSLLNMGTSVFIVGLNIVFVPLMLHTFGTEFYGVLSVTWMVLANFGWLDFGFSRASARYVSQELARGRHDDAALWTVTAVVSQAFLGGLGAILIWYFAPFIVDHIHVQKEHRELVILTLKLFAFSIPIDFANRSITGVMQAGQRFDWVNGLSLFSTLSTFAVYGIGILKGADFKAVVYGLFILRVVNLLASYWGATKVLSALRSLSYLEGLTVSYWSRAAVLFRYGLWVASAAVVGPLLLFFDQWMISVLVGVSLLPYYTIPSNLLWRMGLFPTSLTTTLFPAFSALEAKTDWARIENYFVRAHRYLLTAIIPILFVLFVWGGEILRIWIGSAFAAQATLPLRLLVFGFVIGLLAPLSGALLEAVGRPDMLVKVYLIELPFNIVVVWSLTKYFGIGGAAFSYTVRTAIETIILWVVVYRIVPFSAGGLLRRGLLRPSLTIIPLGLGAYCIRGASVKSYADITLTLVLLAAYVAYAYFLVFDSQDRTFGMAFYRTRMEKLLAKIFGHSVLAGVKNS
jgi:O-antigen/teichoic acid export membrane protein